MLNPVRQSNHVGVRLGIVAGLVATLLIAAPATVQAATFTSIPERLYMVPAGGDTSLPPGIPGPIVAALAGLKVGTLQFDGTPDVIVGDDREIVVAATQGPNGCELIDEPEGVVDYDIDDCTRLILNVGVDDGRIRLENKQLRFRDYTSDPDGGGPLDLDDDDPTEWVWRLPDGAVLDSFGGGDLGTDPAPGNPTDPGDPNNAAGYLNLELNGDTDMLNAALESLVYIPPVGYRDTDEASPPRITVSLQGGDAGSSLTTDTIDIRVLSVNRFPTHDGPATFDAPAATEETIPGPFTVVDQDNDEDVDTDLPGDLPDGPNDEMLLVGYLDCGTTPVANTGVHFASAAFAPVVGTLADFLGSRLDPTGAGPFVALAVEALNAINPDIAEASVQTGDETEWTTLFAGVGTMGAVRAALSTVTFRHDTPDDACTLYTVVSDLGNNGLPVQWLAAPPPAGFEIPMIGFDWNELEITTGELQEIDISFDPGTIVALESFAPVDVGAALHISPAIHPGFTVRWDVLPTTADVPGPDEATAGDDFTGTFDNTLDVPPNVTTIPFPLDNADALDDSPNTTVRSDGVSEGNETFRFQLVLDEHDPPDGWVITSDIPSRTVVIIDDDDLDGPREVLSVSDASVTEGNAGPATMTFTVTLDGLADGNESFVVKTVGGTATSPADFVPVDETFTFAPGTDTLDIDVTVNGDTLVESDPHTFTLELSGPANNVTLGADTTGIGSIDDDDVPAISIDDVAIAEGNSATTNATFTVSLSDPANSAVTVQYATANGTATVADSDYTSTSGTRTIVMGATTATITVPILGDAEVEANETFTVNLTSPTGATIADASGTGTITNDDQVSVINIADATIAEGNTGPLTVSMTNPAGRTCAVLMTTTNGTAVAPDDFTALNAAPVTLVSVVSATTNLATSADAATEGPEILTATIALAPGADANCQIGDATATITIDDDPNAPVIASVTDVSIIEGNAGSANLVFTIALTGGLVSGTETVGYTTSDTSATAGSDYTATSGIATFAAGVTTAQVVVPIAGDTAVEPDETFGLTLGAPVGLSIGAGSAIGTIVNDDTASVLSIADKTILEGNLDQLTVSMTDPTGRTCAVEVTTTNGTAEAPGDFTALDGAVVTLAGVASATTDLSTNSDGTPDDGETLTATIVLADPADANCVLGDATATITIDDTPPPLTAQVADVMIVEGDAGFTNLVFTITLSGPAQTGAERIDFATTGGSAAAGTDYTTTSGTATFGVGVSTFPVSVAIVGDTAVEPDETFTLTLSNPSSVTIADGSATGTIANNDVVGDPPPTPLTIDVPDNIVRPNDPGQPGAVVSWPTPTTLGGTPPVTVACSPASGGFFPLGPTTVTCTATDSALSQLVALSDGPFAVAAALSTGATFTVTVVDNEPPTIADLPDLVRTTPAGPVPVAFPLPAASDNSGVPPTVTCTAPSGTLFALGIATVTCTATDGSGNQASSSFLITVIADVVAPLPPQPGPAVVPTAVPTGSPTSGPTASPTDQLPETGGAPGRLLLIATGLLLLGLTLRRGTIRRLVR